MSAENEPEIVPLPADDMGGEDPGDLPGWKVREEDRLMIDARSNALDTMVVAWSSQVIHCHDILLGAQRKSADEPWKEAPSVEESKKIEAAHEKVRLAAAAKLIRLLGEQYDVKSAWLSPIPEVEAC